MPYVFYHEDEYNGIALVCVLRNFACSILFIQCYRNAINQNGNGNSGSSGGGVDVGNNKKSGRERNESGGTSKFTVDPVFGNSTWQRIQPLFHLSHKHERLLVQELSVARLGYDV